MAEFRRIRSDGVIREVRVESGLYRWFDGSLREIDQAEHLPPTEPGTVVCVHLNYRSRLDELARKQPPAPTYFLKPVSCLNSHRGRVVRPLGCKYLNYEGEFVLVVGSTTRNIMPEQAPDRIMGWTIANDFGLHDFRDTDENSMVRVKGSDTLGVVGPALVTDWDFHGKSIRTLVDGRVVQEDSTNNLLWDPYYLLADLSRSITFRRGDLILTGTPAFSRPVESGCTVSVEVEGLGRLDAHVVDAEQGIPVAYGAQPTASDGVLSVALGSDFKRRG